MFMRTNDDETWLKYTVIAITTGLFFCIIAAVINPVFAHSVWPVLVIVFLITYAYLFFGYCLDRFNSSLQSFITRLADDRTRRKTDKISNNVLLLEKKLDNCERKIDHIAEVLEKNV